jgi:hypothetical protein
MKQLTLELQGSLEVCGAARGIYVLDLSLCFFVTS